MAADSQKQQGFPRDLYRVGTQSTKASKPMAGSIPHWPAVLFHSVSNADDARLSPPPFVENGMRAFAATVEVKVSMYTVSSYSYKHGCLMGYFSATYLDLSRGLRMARRGKARQGKSTYVSRLSKHVGGTIPFIRYPICMYSPPEAKLRNIR